MSLTTHRTAYISRTEVEPPVVARREPVVWGAVDDGPLDAAALERYERDGFLSFEDLLGDDEVYRLVARVEALATDPALRDDPRVIREPDGDDVRSVFEVHRLDPVLAELTADPRLADVARQIVGGEVYLHQTRVNRKPPLRGREFSWHSDFETWHHEDGIPEMRTVSAVVSLSENRIDNGSLMIIPGSHRSFVGCAGATPDAHHEASLRRQEIGTPSDDALTQLVHDHGIETVTGRAGSVTFFDSNCMHGSNGNITPFARCNLFFVYNAVDNAPELPFGGTAPRPEHIAHRHPVPVR